MSTTIHRLVMATGTQATSGSYSLQGIIDSGSGILTGSLNLLDVDGMNHTTAVTGTIVDITATPQTLAITALDTATLNVSGTASIAADGTLTAAMAGTDPNAVVVSLVLSGSVAQQPVVYETPGVDENDAAGFFAGVDPDADPCAVAKVLNAAILELVSGKSIARVEVSGRGSLYFQKGDMTELKSQLQHYQQLCRVASGEIASTRTRRMIRINPYT